MHDGWDSILTQAVCKKAGGLTSFSHTVGPSLTMWVLGSLLGFLGPERTGSFLPQPALGTHCSVKTQVALQLLT